MKSKHKKSSQKRALFFLTMPYAFQYNNSMAKITKQRVVKTLKQCIDPELHIDIWSLGLIYDISIKTKNKQTIIDITMTLTTPACALGPFIAQDIKTKIEKIKDVKECNVIITFEPRWTPDKMTEEAKAQLGFI